MHVLTHRRRLLFAAVSFLLAPADIVGGDYSITPLSDGSSDLTVSPGETFTLELRLTSDAGDEHLSSEFRLLFSQPGLMYTDYDWGIGYSTGGTDDVSKPSVDELSQGDHVVDSSSFADTADIDLYFSNLTEDGDMFGEGVLTSLTLTVPAAWDPVPDSIEIWVMPELFFDGFNVIPTTAGPMFTLVIPAPPTFGFVVVALFVRRSRRLTTDNAEHRLNRSHRRDW